MKLATGVQEALIALLCYNDKEGAVVSGLVSSNDFDPVYKELADLALSYRSDHKEAPGEHTADLVDRACELHPTFERQFDRLYESLIVTTDNINTKYVLERAQKFVRHQELKRATASLARLINTGTEESLAEAESVIHKHSKVVTTSFDPGTYFIHDIAGTLGFLEEPDEAFPTGIPELDIRNLGPVRGQYGILSARTGLGKTWWLLQLAMKAHQHGHKVLYINLEMSTKQFMMRLIQHMFSITKRRTERLSYRRFRRVGDMDSWGMDFDTKWMRNLDAFEDDGIGAKIARKLQKFQDTERFLVKSFPQRTLSVQGLEAYLDTMEHQHKFIPDLVLIDYVDIMKRDPNLPRWEGLTDLGQHVRRIAQERHIGVNSVTQVKATAAGGQRVELHERAGSWDSLGDVDVALTAAQTEREKEAGLARLHVAKGRGDESGFEVLISQCLDIGKFCMDSIRMGKEYREELGRDQQ